MPTLGRSGASWVGFVRTSVALGGRSSLARAGELQSWLAAMPPEEQQVGVEQQWRSQEQPCTPGKDPVRRIVRSNPSSPGLLGIGQAIAVKLNLMKSTIGSTSDGILGRSWRLGFEDDEPAFEPLGGCSEDDVVVPRVLGQELSDVRLAGKHCLAEAHRGDLQDALAINSNQEDDWPVFGNSEFSVRQRDPLAVPNRPVGQRRFIQSKEERHPARRDQRIIDSTQVFVACSPWIHKGTGAYRSGEAHAQ